tara:strand:+ start:70 stop:552 length:483 start_codon:yes stop_codon:yes gene_type:complete
MDRAKKVKKTGVKRASNRSFEAKRRNRVNNAMKHLKTICLKKTKTKSATKIEVLEIAIALLSVVHGENKMDFDAEYKKADSTVGAVLTSKAKQSGAADIQRSIRERKRRMRVNILETELSRLAMHGRNGKASKCAILEQACSALGNPVPDLSDDDEDDDE